MKKYLSFIPLLALLVLLAGCGAGNSAEEDAGTPAPSAEMTAAVPEGDIPCLLDLSAGGAAPARAEWSAPDEFNITAPGVYELTGAMEGRVTVDADGPVELILAGVELTGPECLRVRSGDPVTVTLAEGTTNILSDGASEPDGNANAPLYASAPLTIRGDGVLSVRARANNGIQVRDDLTVAGGTVIVSAPNNGLKAVGRLSVTGGKVSVFSGGDGLAAADSRVAAGSIVLSGGQVTVQAGDRGADAAGVVTVSGGSLSLLTGSDGLRGGTVEITGGELTIDAQGDGVQAVSALYVEGGALDIRSGGGGGGAISHPGESFGPWGQVQSGDDTPSAKGLKSDGSISISGGTVNLDTADDAIHCGSLCTIDGGEITIVSTDDAIHADDMLVIRDGLIRIDDCFEGLEAFAVEVRGGDITIRAVNDGINANGMEMMFGWGGAQNSEFTSLSGAETTYFLMAGGRVDLVVTGSMSNQGDGVDSNGAVYITGGELVVSTYGSFMENGLDTGWGGPVVTGGMVLAGGSSTMAESFSSSSTQCCAVIPTSYMPDGTEVTITDEDGNVLWSVVMADGFSCLQLSHPALQEGHIYTLTYGDQSTELDFTATTNISRARGFGGPGRPF